eukprot:TRINITY_DN7877_c0_g1_i1.p1 TRINITY_DN7877_c0_g1~~TRINITY_DN7877_c0_g1_i1.p1  ORF type:complete len:244 (+),score=64.13 TRINITY_DN7877_c0_g1_i1:27-758(+)
MSLVDTYFVKVDIGEKQLLKCVLKLSSTYRGIKLLPLPPETSQFYLLDDAFKRKQPLLFRHISSFTYIPLQNKVVFLYKEKSKDNVHTIQIITPQVRDLKTSIHNCIERIIRNEISSEIDSESTFEPDIKAPDFPFKLNIDSGSDDTELNAIENRSSEESDHTEESMEVEESIPKPSKKKKKLKKLMRKSRKGKNKNKHKEDVDVPNELLPVDDLIVPDGYEDIIPPDEESSSSSANSKSTLL